MKIVGARWTPGINMMVIACSCGRQFEHRADRWIVHCPQCKRQEHLGSLRENVTWV